MERNALFATTSKQEGIAISRYARFTERWSVQVFSCCYRTCTEYVPFPERIPISVAVGRHARNLKSAMPKSLQFKCVVVPTGRPDKREVPTYKHSNMSVSW